MPPQSLTKGCPDLFVLHAGPKCFQGSIEDFINIQKHSATVNAAGAALDAVAQGPTTATTAAASTEPGAQEARTLGEATGGETEPSAEAAVAEAAAAKAAPAANARATANSQQPLQHQHNKQQEQQKNQHQHWMSHGHQKPKLMLQQQQQHHHMLQQQHHQLQPQRQPQPQVRFMHTAYGTRTIGYQHKVLVVQQA